MFNVASHRYIEHVSLAVSDEVWHQLHPDAGRLSRRAVARVWIVIGLALALVVAGTTVWQSGTVVPQLSWDLSGIKATEPRSDMVGIDVRITNTGLATVIIDSVGRSGPGLDLVRTQGQFPVRLGPTMSVGVILFYRITDCARAPVGSWPVAVQVHRSWGIQTANPRYGLGDSDFPWQRSVTGPWCHSQR